MWPNYFKSVVLPHAQEASSSTPLLDCIILLHTNFFLPGKTRVVVFDKEKVTGKCLTHFISRLLQLYS